MSDYDYDDEYEDEQHEEVYSSKFPLFLHVHFIF